MEIDLNPGDVFLSKNPMMLGRAINSVQKFYAGDNSSIYSHAGLIINNMGKTLECLWTVKSRALFWDLKGEQVLIGRHPGIGFNAFQIGFGHIKNHVGQWYPLHRLLFFLIKPSAKYFNPSKHLVCSELVAKFLWSIGLMDYYLGVNPDDLESMIRRWKEWQIVYEGVI